MERVEPAGTLPERQMLEGWVDYHRATLLMKCAGLTDDQLRLRAVPPSSMSLLGLVRHCVEVEHFWFQCVMAHVEPSDVYCTPEHRDADFDDVDTASVAEAFETYEATITRTREILAGIGDLDATAVEHGNQVSLRWVLTHVIEEYARHSGHADLLRECIDGVTGE